MMTVTQECRCDAPGFCSLHRRHEDPSDGRYMSEIRWNECHNKPHYFEVFLQESITGGAEINPDALRGIPETDWSQPTACRHLGKELATDRVCKMCGSRGKLYTIRACEKHKECSERKRDRKVENCLTCDDYDPAVKPPEIVKVQFTKPTSFKKTKPIQGFLRTGNGYPADNLQDHFRGAACFLLCGGPSLSKIDLGLLNERGIMTAAINNAGAFFPADICFMVDSPIRFHEAMWENPNQMKFTRIDVATDEIRRRTSGGEMVRTGKRSNTMPNTYFYKVSHFFTVENFLDKQFPAWQAEWQTPDSPNGKKGKRHVKRSTFFIALRMLYWLGFRAVFLLGADFRYKPGDTYAFKGCHKSPGACGTNNTSMGVVREWMNLLQPEFERRGYHIYNCTEGSKLTAFPLISFEEAWSQARWQGDVDTTGLYGGN